MELKANATPKEIGAFLRAIREDAGAKAYTGADIREDGMVDLNLWPAGLLENSLVHGSGADWKEAAAALVQKWEAQRANHRSVRIRKMSLEIIQATADQGVCTDASLRLTFDQSEIDQFGDEAVAMADDMASNGPFSITRREGANAA